MSVSDKAGPTKPCKGANEVPLCMAPSGVPFRLARVAGGRRMQHRLAEIGLTAGASFTVVSGSPAGPLIIAIRGARLVIGKGLVARIFVRPA